ncbi:MAG: RNase adapter RapZ [Sedimenticola sp.]
MKLVIITGLSGSGKSIALHTLEDRGYYCIDNLPVFLLPSLAAGLADREGNHFEMAAVSIDARTPLMELESIPTLLKPLKERGIDHEIIFLEAQEEILIRRFSETRRKHPLSIDNRPLTEAIELERKLLSPFLTAADLRIDTSHTNLHELRGIISSRIRDPESGKLSLLFLSFGYKHGVPRDADFVYDARCLPNPYWQPSLRQLTGRDSPVIDFLREDPRVQELQQEITGFLERWIPLFEADNRSYLTVAIGCTGGQHRSVFLVEQLSKHFYRHGRESQTRHRELP